MRISPAVPLTPRSGHAEILASRRIREIYFADMSETPPPPESSSPPPAPGSPARALEGSGLPPSVGAGLACLFSLVGGIIFLVLEKKNHFVRLWAMQSVFLGSLGLAISVVFRMVYFIFGQLPLLGRFLVLIFSLLHLAFALVWFIGYVITVVKAFSNEAWEIPWLGKLARIQLERLDAKNPPAA